MSLDDSLTLLRALQHPHLYPHPVTHFDLRETHISWVLLTGPFAYKIKKPVNFGFVDFSSLAQRHFFCHEEIRLNQRSAPDIYVDVLPISGTPDHPRLDGQGEPFEFAVKMRQFTADATLDHVLSQVRPEQVDQLARDIAAFHHNVAGADQDTSFGTSGLIARIIAEVFEQIPSHSPFSEHQQALEKLRHWLTQFHTAHAGDFEKRKMRGFVRECHGDLHLANLVLLHDRIIAFDGIEFSERLRWIDVINDVAFTVMDFQARGQPALARRFLNRYLEFTGDYEGLGLLPFYEVYRALVRVKVAGLAFAQVRRQDLVVSPHVDDFVRYLSAARSLTESNAPWLIIMHGVSGTGKSTVSETLLEHTGAIRLRSDVERKRLFELSPLDQSSGELKPAVYGRETTRKTYDRLHAFARQLLLFGYPVIVDATFLKRQHRDAFRKLAASLNVPFLILDMHATPTTLRQRVTARAASDVSEADLSVLEQQEHVQEPLGPDERAVTVMIHADTPFDPAEVVGILESRRKAVK